MCSLFSLLLDIFHRIIMNRQRHVNAGVNDRYDEPTYRLVSFPDHSKHALVPSRVVNVDPIDDRTASIKVRGIRRGTHIVGSGKFIDRLALFSGLFSFFDELFS